MLDETLPPPPDIGPGAADNADADPDTGPNRRCIVTGEILPVARLVRFVVGPDGAVVPHVEGRLPGRGLWLSARRDVVNTALRKKAFARAARRPVSVPEDLADRVEGLIVRRCVELIGMARRAGQLVAGFDQVRVALSEGRGGLLLEASDGSRDGREKLVERAPKVPVAVALSSIELGAALGRDRFVHLLLAQGRLAERLHVESERLAGLRTGNREASLTGTG